jgi:hypothetical protein
MRGKSVFFFRNPPTSQRSSPGHQLRVVRSGTRPFLAGSKVLIVRSLQWKGKC